MTSRESFLLMWDMEVAATQRVLAAVPDKNMDWRPHPKSRSAVELTAFVAGHAPILATFLEKGEVRAQPMPSRRSPSRKPRACSPLLPRSWDRR